MILLNSSNFAYERPPYSTKDSARCGDGQEDTIEDIYNVLLVHFNNYLKNLIKKKEENDKIWDEEAKVWEKAQEETMKK